MKLAVCDENQEDRAKLRELIGDYGRKKGRTMELREFESVQPLLEADDWIRECRIVFLGISPKENGGLDAAKHLKDRYPDLYVILVSDHVKDAIDGYRVKAARFLMKDRLSDALVQCLDEIIGEFREIENKMRFSFVEGEYLLKVSDILYVETDRHKNVFYTAHASYRMYRKLDEIQEMLVPFGFVRVHRSFLVNMQYVKRISSYVLYLTGGTGISMEISVPKSRYAYVKREFADYQKKHWTDYAGGGAFPENHKNGEEGNFVEYHSCKLYDKDFRPPYNK